MADNMLAIQIGRLNLSRITYHCDLQRSSGIVIPLGVMAELSIGSWRAVGLIARTSLTETESTSVGRLMRPKLSSPFDLLKPEFEWAFAQTSPGTALARLASRFSESLVFGAPIETEKKMVLRTDPTAAEAILRDLRKARDDEFYLMLAEAEEQTVPIEDATRLRIAA